ncbi:hypothetical protein B296_00054257, partial [Ensete ventricosum]
VHLSGREPHVCGGLEGDGGEQRIPAATTFVAASVPGPAKIERDRHAIGIHGKSSDHMPSDACYVVIGTLTHDSNAHQTEPARKLKPNGLVSLSLLLGIGAEQGGPPRSRVGRGFPGDAKRKDMAKRELSSTLKNLKASPRHPPPSAGLPPPPSLSLSLSALVSKLT